MKVAFLAVFYALALSGCTQTVEEMNYSQITALERQIVSRCSKHHLTDKEMNRCIDIEMQSEIHTRRRAATVEDWQLILSDYNL